MHKGALKVGYIDTGHIGQKLAKNEHSKKFQVSGWNSIFE
jgi:phosphoglycerate dehydrogenase-like enzyme